jgi:hypothetical protein
MQEHAEPVHRPQSAHPCGCEQWRFEGRMDDIRDGGIHGRRARSMATGNGRRDGLR